MVITFVGMPGCGKSCMGRAMSGKLKMKLIDSDKLIEKRCGKKLQELIDELGVVEFRRIEEEVLMSIEGDNMIISTGGSAIYSDAGMKHLKELGKVFYLFCSYETMRERLGDFSKRGIVVKPGQTMKDLYDERAPLYKKYADVTILCDGNAYPQYQGAVLRAAKRFIGKGKKQSNKKEGL